MSMQQNPEKRADVVVLGGGLIGMAIALKLHERGASVIVFERDSPMQKASVAAAGMLAVDDPHNPAELLPLSRLSGSLYPEFLSRMENLSGLAVPYQTETTMQYAVTGSSTKLAERSLDPRMLAAALLATVQATSIQVLPHTELAGLEESVGAVLLRTTDGRAFTARHVVHTTGAWFHALQGVQPRKGQMLRVQIPATLSLNEVHRSERVYIVPRTAGPQAGTAIIGATVEDAGFDTTTHAEDLMRLRSMASELLPALASAEEAPQLESWAGLRPGTPDQLPMIGALHENPRQIVAAGHFRNGILLAPATAEVVAELIENKQTQLSLSAFRPERFA